MTSYQKFRKAWVKANTFGFMAFLLMIPISFILLTFFRPPALEGLTIQEVFQQSAGKGPLYYGIHFYMVLQAGHFIHYMIVGAVLGLLQYQVLKEYIRSKTWWMIVTILGLEIILLGDLIFMGLATGGAPGPLEPLLIGLGGGGFIALFQYLYLRSAGIKSGKWVGWWILGIITGIVTSAIFIFLYEHFFSEAVRQNVAPTASVVIDWLSFILPYFTLIGFFAGLLSAKPMYKTFEQSKNVAQDSIVFSQD